MCYISEKKPTITIDTNLINAKQRFPSMNKLERWCDEGKISIVGTFRLKMEIGAYKNKQASEKERNIPNIAEPCVLDQSFADAGAYCVGSDNNAPQFWDLAGIMFPRKDYRRLTKNESNDVMHLMSHYFSGSSIFITNDKKDFISNNRREQLKSKFGIIIMTPDEVVKEFKTKFGWT